METRTAGSEAPPTQLRARSPERGGVTTLHRNRATYSDGSEQRLLDVLRSAADLGSSSEELELAIDDWPTEYHLSAARANALRLLEIDPMSRVLEIGAGCGAMTRYLGERCAIVDAIEPVAARAKVAATRCAELESVRVFHGGIEDVSGAGEYDLVLVWGVLEYIGRGAVDDGERLVFLRRAKELLAPGGQLICAIENALGAKYLAGSPDDHTSRPFDSVEGFLRSTPARTFSRRRLVDMLRSAGLTHAMVLQALPDYKMTRLLISDVALEDPELRRVAYGAVSFPSPDRAGSRWPSAAEGPLWRELVDAGLGGEFGNSFVVIASSGPSDHPLWPPTRMAAIAATGRRLAYRVLARIERSADTTTVHRERLDVSAPAPSGSQVHGIVAAEPYIAGPLLIEVMARSSIEELQALIAQWAQAVEDAWSSQPDLLDLTPQNFKVVAGQLQSFDQEWSDPTWTREARLGRLAFQAALQLRDLLPHDELPQELGLSTLGDLAAWIARQLGHDDVDLDAFVEHEARFSAAVGARGIRSDNTVQAACESLEFLLAEPLTAGALARRQEYEEMAIRRAEALECQTQAVARLEAVVARQHAELTSLRKFVGASLGRVRRKVARRLGRVAIPDQSGSPE